MAQDKRIKDKPIKECAYCSEKFVSSRGQIYCLNHRGMDYVFNKKKPTEQVHEENFIKFA